MMRHPARRTGLIATVLGLSLFSSSKAWGDSWIPQGVLTGTSSAQVVDLAISAGGDIAVNMNNGHPVTTNETWLVSPNGKGQIIWKDSGVNETLMDTAFIGSTPYLLTTASQAFGRSVDTCCQAAFIRKVQNGRAGPARRLFRDVDPRYEGMRGQLLPVDGHLLATVVSHAGVSATWVNAAGVGGTPQVLLSADIRDESAYSFAQASSGDRAIVADTDGTPNFVATGTVGEPLRKLPLDHGASSTISSAALSGGLISLVWSTGTGEDEFNAEDLTATGPDQVASFAGAQDSAQAVGDPAGDEIISWTETPCGPSGGCALAVIFRHHGGAFSTPLMLYPTNANVQIGFTGDGTGIIAWSAGSQITTMLLAPDATTFTPAEQLTEAAGPTNPVQNPPSIRLVTGPGHAAALAWQDRTGNIHLSRLG